MTEKPKRRWYQFSLRTLLVATAVCALLMGLLTNRLIRAGKQRRIVAEIQGVGGAVLYDFQYDFTPENHRIPGWERPPTPTLIPRLILGDDFFAGVVFVQITSSVFADADLRRLAGLQELSDLQHLCLVGSQVSDEGLEYLSGLAELRILDLTDTQVTPEGIKRLQEALPDCKIIY